MKAYNEKTRGLADMKNNGDYCLHGDVIVAKSYQIEGFDAMVLVKDSCLAYGELTGHAHKIFGEPGDYEVRENPATKERHLKVVREVCLRHQEHEGIQLPPGFYRIGIQQEYDPFEKLVRGVQD